MHLGVESTHFKSPWFLCLQIHNGAIKPDLDLRGNFSQENIYICPRDTPKGVCAQKCPSLFLPCTGAGWGLFQYSWYIQRPREKRGEARRHILVLDHRTVQTPPPEIYLNRFRPSFILVTGWFVIWADNWISNPLDQWASYRKSPVYKLENAHVTGAPLGASFACVSSGLWRAYGEHIAAESLLFIRSMSTSKYSNLWSRYGIEIHRNRFRLFGGGQEALVSCCRLGFRGNFNGETTSL